MGNVFRTHGAVSWVELMTDDPEAAGKFYADLLDWKVQDGSMDSGDSYDVFTPAGEQAPIGGIMKMPEQCKNPLPVWGMYVTVDNVDKAAADALKLGGKVIKEATDMPGVGRMAVLQDPQGAVFCVIRYEEGVEN